MAHPVWRGVTVCDCMTAPLNELAKTSGNDILVSPIKGFGSFQKGDTASAGTGSGGGHVDLSLTRLTGAQKLRLEGLARRIGFYADIREPTWWSPSRKRWLKESWQSHLHMVLKDCQHLSDEATRQLKDWYSGGNGLVGNDPDDGDRRFVRQTWAQYKGGGQTAVTSTTAASINLANLKSGKSNTDIKRYQAAVWRVLSASTRTRILTVYKLKESQIADGFYGRVTTDMTVLCYRAIAAAEPKGGWPIWKEPGPRLIKRLGFVPVGARDLDDPTPDEFGEPDSITDPVSVNVDPHAGVVQ